MSGTGFLGTFNGSGTNAHGTIWARFHQQTPSESEFLLTAPGLRTTSGYTSVTFAALFTPAVNRELPASAKLRVR